MNSLWDQSFSQFVQFRVFGKLILKSAFRGVEDRFEFAVLVGLGRQDSGVVTLQRLHLLLEIGDLCLMGRVQIGNHLLLPRSHVGEFALVHLLKLAGGLLLLPYHLVQLG